MRDEICSVVQSFAAVRLLRLIPVEGVFVSELADALGTLSYFPLNELKRLGLITMSSLPGESNPLCCRSEAGQRFLELLDL